MKQFGYHITILFAILQCPAPTLTMAKGDGDNRMPLAKAVALDNEAMKLFPGTPPMALILPPRALQ
jgi:hypothetical protein